EAFDVARAVARDLVEIEAVEGLAVGRALAQDGDPGEPGLRAFEHQELEETSIVVHRNAPLPIVVSEVERVLPGPGAALQFAGRRRRALLRGRRHAGKGVRVIGTGSGGAGSFRVSYQR